MSRNRDLFKEDGVAAVVPPLPRAFVHLSAGGRKGPAAVLSCGGTQLVFHAPDLVRRQLFGERTAMAGAAVMVACQTAEALGWEVTGVTWPRDGLQ